MPVSFNVPPTMPARSAGAHLSSPAALQFMPRQYQAALTRHGPEILPRRPLWHPYVIAIVPACQNDTSIEIERLRG